MAAISAGHSQKKTSAHHVLGRVLVLSGWSGIVPSSHLRKLGVLGIKWSSGFSCECAKEGDRPPLRSILTFACAFRKSPTLLERPLFVNNCIENLRVFFLDNLCGVGKKNAVKKEENVQAERETFSKKLK